MGRSRDEESCLSCVRSSQLEALSAEGAPSHGRLLLAKAGEAQDQAPPQLTISRDLLNLGQLLLDFMGRMQGLVAISQVVWGGLPHISDWMRGPVALPLAADCLPGLPVMQAHP